MIKRAVDLLLAGAALVVLSPLLGLVAWLIRVRLGTPVIFRQERIGAGENPFVLRKFRTMDEAYDEYGRPLPDADRLSPFGARLRALSVDELPQLWNVLVGDMSLVGPRPLPVDYLTRYTKEEKRRHEVRPGLTGWAQINGRNELAWDQRLAMDTWYVDHRSLWLDIRILLCTACRVWSRSGISAEGEVTMGELRPELGVHSTRLEYPGRNADSGTVGGQILGQNSTSSEPCARADDPTLQNGGVRSD